jgi:hypothetical protein
MVQVCFDRFFRCLLALKASQVKPASFPEETGVVQVLFSLT